ncbi:AAA ATPase [Clostridium sp. DL-VIII]|uniref:AAA family ATPase n=1 Tax=Clostridium sp. DL-VIII TaxID=641107 RepID=UPI00023B0420|nr:AAA family ATPase [Clostridium sp. DL-VIII]EHJ01891.1 AAA ATPase [Clostridium sp. DL-VIII]
MPINNVKLTNITVFKKLNLDMSPGINIIIGENGTGKTHLLKMIYYIDSEKYYPLEEKYIRKYKEDKKCKPTAEIKYDDGLVYWIGNNMKSGKDNDGKDPIYIPVSEMLSHSKGFLALYDKYDVAFDSTERDIISNAELPETREVSELNKKVLDKISDIINGKVVYENDTFYILKDEGFKVEFSVEAEGLRKFGLLFKLIRNGLIEKGSVLLWDEPEANINPELIPVLVDILLELQSEGVQIFISTHSYNLAKYFEVKRKENNQVLFHSLYKKGNEVLAQTEEYFGKLSNNKIISADEKLLDEVFEKNLED